jgi:hypothetical protein
MEFFFRCSVLNSVNMIKDFRGIIETFQKKIEQISLLGHDRSFPNIFQSIIHKKMERVKDNGCDGCETSRSPHCLDNQLTDGSEVIGLTRRPRFTPRKVLIYVRRLSRLQGHIAAGWIRSITKSNVLIGNRNRDLPA